MLCHLPEERERGRGGEREGEGERGEGEGKRNMIGNLQHKCLESDQL